MMYQIILPQESENRPLPRSGHRIITTEGNVYVIGGFVQHDTELVVEGEIWRYNILTKTWRKLCFKNCSFTLAASHAVCLIDHTIIVYGGTGTKFAVDIDNTLRVLDLHTYESYILPHRSRDGMDRNFPVPTYGHTLTYVNLDNHPFLYKVGGAMGYQYTSDVYRYSLRDKCWELVSHSDESTVTGTGRYRHDTFLYKEKLYFIGGTNNDITYPLWPLSVFDLRSNIWSTVELTGLQQTSVRFQSSVQVDNVIYVIGGVSEDGQTINNKIFCIDLEALTCYSVGLQRSPAYFHDAAYLAESDEIYSFGGTYRVAPVLRTNQLHRFRLNKRIRSLAMLAWTNLFTFLVNPTRSPIASFRRKLAPCLIPSRSVPEDNLTDKEKLIEHIRSTLTRLFSVYSFKQKWLTDVYRGRDRLTQITLYHQACYKATLVVLIIRFGKGLGLHCQKSVFEEEHLIYSLKDLLLSSASTETEEGTFSQIVKAAVMTDAAGDRSALLRRVPELQHWPFEEELLLEKPSVHQYEQRFGARMPLQTALDEFYLFFFLFLMHIPTRFLYLFPNARTFYPLAADIESNLQRSLENCLPSHPPA